MKKECEECHEDYGPKPYSSPTSDALNYAAFERSKYCSEECKNKGAARKKARRLAARKRLARMLAGRLTRAEKCFIYGQMA